MRRLTIATGGFGYTSYTSDIGRSLNLLQRYGWSCFCPEYCDLVLGLKGGCLGLGLVTSPQNLTNTHMPWGHCDCIRCRRKDRVFKSTGVEHFKPWLISTQPYRPWWLPTWGGWWLQWKSWHTLANSFYTSCRSLRALGRNAWPYFSLSMVFLVQNGRVVLISGCGASGSRTWPTIAHW